MNCINCFVSCFVICVYCIIIIFVTSVVSLVGIKIFLHKMGGGCSVFGGGGLTSAFFNGLGVLFPGLCLFFPGISKEKPRGSLLVIVFAFCSRFIHNIPRFILI